jgi:hypothetical protein
LIRDKTKVGKGPAFIHVRLFNGSIGKEQKGLRTMAE